MLEKLNSHSGNDLEIWALHMQGSTVCCPENETNKKNPIFTFEMKWEVKNMNYAFMWRRDILSLRLQSNSSFILKLLICAAFCLPLCLWQTLDCVGTIGFI